MSGYASLGLSWTPTDKCDEVGDEDNNMAEEEHYNYASGDAHSPMVLCS